jgi:DNA-binding IclR family transcriptional regulator
LRSVKRATGGSRGGRVQKDVAHKMKMRRDNKYPVKSLVKALRILEYLGSSETGGNLTQISKELQIDKSTVHRMLATLRDYDFVGLDPLSSNYILGAKILQFSDQLSHQSALIRHGEPILARLARSTNETCNLGVLDGDMVLYLIKKESERPLRMSGQVGKRLPAHCTALGKVLLAQLSREELRRVYAQKPVFETPTPNTISTLPALESHLEEVRRTGVALDNEEIYPEVVCMAAPVRDYRGRSIAALSISFPKHRMDAARLDVFRPLLLEACDDFSRHLGYRGTATRAVCA